MENVRKFLGVSQKKAGASGTVWALPNYDGELFTSAQLETPLLSIIGGLNGGLQTDNFEFATSSLYDLPAAAQPAITETASETAPTATQVTRDQNKNVTQIFHEAINITYAKLSNAGRLSGINTVGNTNNVTNERDWQIARKLEKLARDINFTLYNGAYQISTSAAVANKMRGMFPLCAAKTTLNASGAALSKPLLQQIFLDMFNAGAIFSNLIIFCGGFQKQKISEIYTVLPDSRSVGGQNIQQIVTDFGNIGIQVDKMVPTANLGLFEVSVMAPVFQPTPEKGNFFYEPLAKTGAAEKGQLFGQIGLDYGPDFLHGSVTNLKTT